MQVRLRKTFRDDWDKLMYARELLESPLCDAIALALDVWGWQIVGQPDLKPDRWYLNKPSPDCPNWADNGNPGVGIEGAKPQLHVIDGGKKDDDA
jgi:hypothetical protein